MERTERSWKVSLKLESFAAVGKFWLKLEKSNEIGKLSLTVVQLQLELSNFGANFPNSIFPISFWTFRLQTFQILVFSNCPFQLHVYYPRLFIFSKTDKVREDESMEQSEDCLTINITVPKNAIKNKQKVPINYFIHGGNNQQGSNAGGNFDGLVSNGIMSVSVNYRLGGLGFFHLKQAETEGQENKLRYTGVP